MIASKKGVVTAEELGPYLDVTAANVRGEHNDGEILDEGFVVSMRIRLGGREVGVVRLAEPVRSFAPWVRAFWRSEEPFEAKVGFIARVVGWVEMALTRRD